MGMDHERNWCEGVPAPVDADGNVVPLATRRLYDEEGREVAATMRAISVRGVRNFTLGAVLNSILTSGAPRPTTEMAILARLADLIDRPTCHLVEDENGYTACSECGCTALCMLDASYCPECGARVVRDGD